MLSYFVNLITFYLILIFFFLKFLLYSPWLLRKNSQNEIGEIEFLSFYLNIRVCIMLIEVDELLKPLLISILFLPL